jgi:hypothetical protein
MKSLLVFICLLGPFFTLAQSRGESDAITRISEVKAFLSIASDSSVSKTKLAKGFSICLTDTSYKVIFFVLAYNLPDGSVYQFPNKGPAFDISKELFKSSVNAISHGSFITVDHIKIEENGRFFKPDSFLLVATE